jgi:hypothetical protein
MTMSRKTLTSAILLLAAAALLIATTHTALAARGGKNTVAMSFDDLPGDAVQSDGFGAYDGRQANDGSRIISAGSRAIYFDFSAAQTWWSIAPFSSGAKSGEIENVTITVVLLDDTTGTVEFEFSGPDPQGSGSTKYSLTMSVSATPSSNGYVLEASSDAELMYLYQSSGPRGNGHFYPPYWERAGSFDMPWGGDVSP